MEMTMTNSMKHTVIENPTWWKRRSALERGLTVIAVSGVLVGIALAISIGVVVMNFRSCNTTTSTGVEASESTCFTPACIHVASSILKSMNHTVDPCDDFYKFACGGFINSTRLRDEKITVSHFTITYGKILEQLRTTFEEKNVSEPRPFKLAKKLYNVCMNKSTIEKNGIDPMVKVLTKLGGWPVLEGDSWKEDDFHWTELMFKLHDVGYPVDYFLYFSISADLKNSSRNLINLDQASLGLSREYLSKGLEDKIVKAYYEYMVDIAIFFGAEPERAKKELMDTLIFEMELANISMLAQKRRDITLLYNLTTVAELSKSFPTIPWKNYINRFLKPFAEIDDNEIINVKSSSYIEKFENFIKTVPKRVQANYIIRRIVASSVSYLNDKIRQRQMQYSKIFTGRTERGPRWMECVNIVSVRFPLSVGSLYVRKYFNEAAKKNTAEMAHDIKNQFQKILETIDWMDKKTRKHALLKATTMTTHIAYPNELLDYSKLEKYYERLEFCEGSYLNCMLNLTLFNTEHFFNKFKKPVNRSDWVTHGRPAVVNAFYTFSENSIQIPAGILQGVFFNNDRPRYMNYGAIGFIIGHEITHGFDDRGRLFDMRGNLVDWWEPATKEKYLEKTKCIINQYGNYTAKEVGLKLNGIRTQGENIADNGGIKEAYLAYKEWSERNKPEPKLPGLPYTPRQMFWLSAAHMWCTANRPEALKLRITSGYHSPSEFRVFGTYSNTPEFSEDFKCPVGSRMNPSKKCRVW